MEGGSILKSDRRKEGGKRSFGRTTGKPHSNGEARRRRIQKGEGNLGVIGKKGGGKGKSYHEERVVLYRVERGSPLGRRMN